MTLTFETEAGAQAYQAAVESFAEFGAGPFLLVLALLKLAEAYIKHQKERETV